MAMIPDPMVIITVAETSARTPNSWLPTCHVVPVRKSTTDAVGPSTPKSGAVNVKNFDASVTSRSTILRVVTIESTAHTKKNERVSSSGGAFSVFRVRSSVMSSVLIRVRHRLRGVTSPVCP